MYWKCMLRYLHVHKNGKSGKDKYTIILKTKALLHVTPEEKRRYSFLARVIALDNFLIRSWWCLDLLVGIGTSRHASTNLQSSESQKYDFSHRGLESRWYGLEWLTSSNSTVDCERHHKSLHHRRRHSVIIKLIENSVMDLHHRPRRSVIIKLISNELRLKLNCNAYSSPKVNGTAWHHKVRVSRMLGLNNSKYTSQEIFIRDENQHAFMSETTQAANRTVRETVYLITSWGPTKKSLERCWNFLSLI